MDFYTSRPSNNEGANGDGIRVNSLAQNEQLSSILIFNKMFFGAILKQDKPFVFNEEYPCALTIGNAILSAGNRADLYIRNGQEEFLVVILTKQRPHRTLDLLIVPTNQIALVVKDQGTIHLIGSYEDLPNQSQEQQFDQQDLEQEEASQDEQAEEIPQKASSFGQGPQKQSIQTKMQVTNKPQTNPKNHKQIITTPKQVVQPAASSQIKPSVSINKQQRKQSPPAVRESSDEDDDDDDVEEAFDSDSASQDEEEYDGDEEEDDNEVEIAIDDSIEDSDQGDIVLKQGKGNEGKPFLNQSQKHSGKKFNNDQQIYPKGEQQKIQKGGWKEFQNKGKQDRQQNSGKNGEPLGNKGQYYRGSR